MYSDLINDLVRVLHEGAYLSVVTSNRLENSNYNIQERKLYTKLIYSVTEKKIYLDYMLSPFIKGVRVKPFVKCALRVGALSILELNLKDYFIVNEMVKVVKKKDFHAAGFVNGVLRNFAGGKLRELPNDPIEKNAILQSIPKEILSLLYKDYREECFSFFKDSPVYNYYRINTIKTKVIDIVKILDEEQIIYKLDGFMIQTKETLINHTLFKEGLIIAQDPSSAKVSLITNPNPNDSVLDVCSAPGGKSLFMSALMENHGEILCCDIYQAKLDKIIDNAKRLGVTNIKTLVADASSYDYQKQFDKVVVDVPCSGLGTIGHKPDLKYRITLDDIADIVNLQQKILLNASRYVKDGGYLTYSTCTINKDENERMIKWFITNKPVFSIVEEHIITPSDNGDGFYICKMKKEVSHE